jgi:acetyltransferase-like isoleucine patch superfamily enzyme
MSRVTGSRKTQTIDFAEYVLTFAVRKTSLWLETIVEPQQHAHRPLAPPQSRSPAAECHKQQSASQIVTCVPTAATQLPEYAQLRTPAPSDEACLNDDRSNRSQPPVSSVLAAQPPSTVSSSTRPCLPPKSEKDKMLSGEPFSPNNAQLAEERDLCSQALFRFNRVEPSVSRYCGWFFESIIAAEWTYARTGKRGITGHVGHGIKVSAPFHCDYGYNLSIGDNVVLGPGCQLLDSGRVVIGRNTKIGARVTISTLKEPVDTRPMTGGECTETAREVYIGENVYVGDGCVVKGGVRIGDNAIVRAGSVVAQASKPCPYRSFGLRPLCNPTVQREEPDRACAGYSSKLSSLWKPSKSTKGRLGRLSVALSRI